MGNGGDDGVGRGVGFGVYDLVWLVYGVLEDILYDLAMNDYHNGLITDASVRMRHFLISRELYNNAEHNLQIL